MNIVNKLTLRSMQQNKRRTLVTIVGVIISVAMIMAVATISISFLELMKKQEIQTSGNWHISYSGITADQGKQIAEHEQTKIVSLMSTQGYAKLEQSKHLTKPYLHMTSLNATAYEQFPLKLVEGRLPLKPNEVVITDEIKRIASVDYPIGTKLQLATGKRLAKDEDGAIIEMSPYLMYGLQNSDGQLRYEEFIEVQSEHEVTVVGVVNQPNWQNGAAYFSIFGYMDDQQLSKLDTAATSLTAYVVNDKVSNAIYNDGRKLAEEIGHPIDQLDFHNGLLRYDGVTNVGGFREVLYSLSAIIIGIIMVGSISLIYNAFAISVSERSRYLGMLSSVGATKAQKRNSVFFESGVIALISIPLGLFFGWLGISITFLFVNNVIKTALDLEAELVTIVTPAAVGISILVSLFTIFISAYIPAIRASRISAIEAIRQTTDIKLSARKVRTLPIVRKLFGMEADIALKNLKRNKRKYQITVFSIIISIVLFLSVSYFTDVLKKTMQFTQTDVSYDLVVYSMPEQKQKEIVAEIAALDTVEKYSLSKQFGMSTIVRQEQFESVTINPDRPEDERLELLDSDGNFYMPVHFIVLDDVSMLQYADSVGVDGQKLLHSEQPNMIVQQTIAYKSDAMKKYIEGKVMKATIGEKIVIQKESTEENGIDEAIEVEVAALVDKLPIGFSGGVPENVYVVISANTAEILLGTSAEFHQYPYRMHIISSDPLKTEEKIIDEHGELFVNNIYKARQREKQMIVLMSVFTYGFIALISAVVVANIFNTISTSIALRKREFAMLQSIGMTPKGFNKMIQYESIFYGLKALLYGLPLSILAMYGIYRSTDSMFDFPFQLNWIYIGITIVFVLTIVLSTMLYASSKVKRENIIDVLKQENI